MTSFAKLLSEQARNYSGRNASLVRQAPAFYRLLVRMLSEEGLPSNLRPIVEHAIDYFEDSSDTIPEDLYGAYGLSDDVYLGAFVADIVLKETKSRELLQRNWDRKSPVTLSIQMVLSSEEELVGNKKEQILARIGLDSDILRNAAVPCRQAEPQRSVSESVLCWASDEGFLNYDGEALAFHSLDKDLLNKTAQLSEEVGDFCFLYPTYRFNLTLPICLELLYDLNYPSPKGSKTTVLLISKAERSFIKNYAKIRTSSLWLFQDVFPIGIVKSDGTLLRRMRLGHGRQPSYAPPRLLISDSTSNLPVSEVPHIGAIVVDLSYLRFNENIEDLVAWKKKNKIPCLITLETNPYSKSFRVWTKLSLPFYSWTKQKLKSLYLKDEAAINSDPLIFDNPFACSIAEIRNKVEGFESKHHLLDDDNDACKSFKKARENYQSLRISAVGELQDKIARRYLLLVKNAEHLLCPPSVYDSQKGYYLYTRPFPVQLDEIEGFRRMFQNEDGHFASLLEKSYLDAEQLLADLQNDNPKSRVVCELVDLALTENKSLLILAKNQTHANATETYIANRFHFDSRDFKEHRIAISNVRDLRQTNAADLCVVSGLPEWETWGILRAAVGKRTVYLLYSDENKIFDYQIKQDNALYERTIKSKNRRAFLSILGDSEADVSGTEAELRSTALDKEWAESASLKLNPIFENLIKEEAAAEIEAEDAIFDDETREKVSQTIIDGFKVTFSDGMQLYVHGEKSLNRIDHKNELKLVTPSRLRKGDLLMIINNNAARSLTSHLFKQAEYHPELQHITVQYLAWVHLLNNHLKESEMTLSELLFKMKQRGTDIQTASALYAWSRALVFQMRNKENIAVVGEIFGDEYLKNEADAIYEAMGKLKRIHIRLIRGLKKMILQGALTTGITDDDEIIDEDLGLHLHQFKDTVRLKQVESVEKAEGIEYQKLNKVSWSNGL